MSNLPNLSLPKAQKSFQGQYELTPKGINITNLPLNKT